MPGSLLDPLLALLVQEDGVSFATRHALNFIGFSLTDDPANNRINVSGGAGGGGTLAGDVVGEADATRVVAISGDEENAEVQLFASSLFWDPTVSEGEAEISISAGELDAGALQFVHNGQRALLALGAGPVLGNDAGINRLTGGLRLTTRPIASNVSLDATAKDAIAWISAVAERQVTLPPASVGRLLVLPFVGPTTPTLRRLGTELINGVAGHYAMEGGDTHGGLTFAVCDGTNWVARTIGGTVTALALGGDVEGDTDANYITQISGSGGEVLVTAEMLIFSAGGDASIESSAETDGAIVVTHDGSNVLTASSTAPEFGTDFSQARLRGGLRLTLRDVDGAIDETTTDAICWLDASTEGTSATLPPATQGRALFFPFVGDNPPTLQRAGSELINGAAADYEMQGDAAGGLGIAFSDGTNWVARTIRNGVTLSGDVTGEASDNAVTTISGDFSGVVAVPATELSFAGPGSIVGAKIAVGFGEALVISHGGVNALVGHKDAPELGNAAGISKLHGGTLFDTRTIAADTTLDASTKETVVYVNATAAARNVTLPALAAGRTFVFMIVGAYPVTIKRAGANPINGVVADYVVPYANACVVVTAVSTTWLARSFSDQQGVTMGPGQGSATASASKIFGFAFSAGATSSFDLTGASYTGLKTAIDAGKMLVVKAANFCHYNWGTGSVAISAAATAASNPQLQGAPMFDGAESPERAPFGTAWLNILGGPIAGTLTVYIAE